LREIDQFPVFAVDFIINILLCRAKMALESPTLAQVTSSPSINTFTKVDPLHDTLVYDWVNPRCSFSKTLGILSGREEVLDYS